MSSDPVTSAVTAGPEFSLLAGSDDYTRYFNLLTHTFERVLQGYQLGGSGETFEAQMVKVYLKRLIATVETLRMKYRYTPSHHRMLWVDSDDSGFPNAQEISLLSVGLVHRERRLEELPPEALLKQLMLDQMFANLEEPSELLWQLAERSYLERLDEAALFLPFVSGLEHEGALLQGKHNGADARTYTTSWGCYDFKTNHPYIHVLTFDQDASEQPLEELGPSHLRLLKVIGTEGSRVPDVGIVAMAIDDGLETIHPKILKRIGFGPLYTPLTLELLGEPEDRHRRLLELFTRHGDEDDVIMAITDEIVFSKRQQVTKPLFSPSGRVREIYHIPETDPESYRRRASVVHKHVLLPHGVAQHLSDDDIAAIPELHGARLLSYDAGGTIHGF